MRKLRLVLLVSAIYVLNVLPAFAGSPIPEIEPNNTFGTAQLIDRNLFMLSGAVSITGKLVPGDVDYFQVPLLAGDFISVHVTVRPASPSASTAIGIFDPIETYVAYDRTTLSGLISADGNWRIAVSGYPDIGPIFVGDDGIPFNGSHVQNIDYLLTVGLIPVPEPGGLLALGSGIAGLLGYSVRRRRVR